jgi:hypothetical protein
LPDFFKGDPFLRMELVNFFIIGAPKCGTTSLQAYLNQHPEICFSRYKEPNYFAFAGEVLPKKGPVSPSLMNELIYSHSLTSIEEYRDQFTHHNHEKIVGDASVRYLYIEPSARRIQSVAPDSKMVAILREPVSRLYSHYCMNKQYQLEPLDLMDAVAAEPERINAEWGWDWHYVNIGLYSKQLKRYYDLFDKSQIKVFLYDEFRDNPIKVINSICSFLEIGQNFRPDVTVRRKTPYWPRNLLLDRWLNRENYSRNLLESIMPRRVRFTFRSGLLKVNSRRIPKINAQDTIALRDYFYEDVSELEEILERNIPWY